MTPQNERQKFVRVLNMLDKKLETDEYIVNDFNVTYDARGVLQIHELSDPDVLTVFFGPGTWKYVAFLEEDIENEQEEKETEN